MDIARLLHHGPLMNAANDGFGKSTWILIIKFILATLLEFHHIP